MMSEYQRLYQQQQQNPGGGNPMGSYPASPSYSQQPPPPYYSPSGATAPTGGTTPTPTYSLSQPQYASPTATANTLYSAQQPPQQYAAPSSKQTPPQSQQYLVQHAPVQQIYQQQQPPHQYQYQPTSSFPQQQQQQQQPQQQQPQNNNNNTWPQHVDYTNQQGNTAIMQNQNRYPTSTASSPARSSEYNNWKQLQQVKFNQAVTANTYAANQPISSNAPAAPATTNMNYFPSTSLSGVQMQMQTQANFGGTTTSVDAQKLQSQAQPTLLQNTPSVGFQTNQQQMQFSSPQQVSSQTPASMYTQQLQYTQNISARPPSYDSTPKPPQYQPTQPNRFQPQQAPLQYHTSEAPLTSVSSTPSTTSDTTLDPGALLGQIASLHREKAALISTFGEVRKIVVPAKLAYQRLASSLPSTSYPELSALRSFFEEMDKIFVPTISPASAPSSATPTVVPTIQSTNPTLLKPPINSSSTSTPTLSTSSNSIPQTVKSPEKPANNTAQPIPPPPSVPPPPPPTAAPVISAFMTPTSSPTSSALNPSLDFSQINMDFSPVSTPQATSKRLSLSASSSLMTSTMKRELIESADYKLALSLQPKQCPLCLEDVDIDEIHTLSCSHTYCRACLCEYFKERIMSKNLPIVCPNPDCKQEISEREMEMLIPPELIEKMQNFLLDCTFEKNRADYSCCPSPDCGYVFVYEEGDPIDFTCPKCNKRYCLSCKVEMHDGKTCAQYQEWAKANLKDTFTEFVKGAKYKQCPNCKCWIELAKGCNHMTCKCGHEFCFSCGKSYPCGCGQDPHAPGFRPNNFAAAVYTPWVVFKGLQRMLGRHQNQNPQQQQQQTDPTAAPTAALPYPPEDPTAPPPPLPPKPSTPTYGNTPPAPLLAPNITPPPPSMGLRAQPVAPLQPNNSSGNLNSLQPPQPLQTPQPLNSNTTAAPSSPSSPSPSLSLSSQSVPSLQQQGVMSPGNAAAVQTTQQQQPTTNQIMMQTMMQNQLQPQYGAMGYPQMFNPQQMNPYARLPQGPFQYQMY
ncbi:IBR domain protein [Pelomyxa schiedti]|nr:IBR domain protein [Pelomyxa schiedti]